MFTRKHTSTARATQRVCDKTVCKTYPVVSNPIQVGRIHITFVIATHHLSRMIVRHNIDNIQRFFCYRLRTAGQSGYRQ